jgi:hypothetical protein
MIERAAPDVTAWQDSFPELAAARGYRLYQLGCRRYWLTAPLLRELAAVLAVDPAEFVPEPQP